MSSPLASLNWENRTNSSMSVAPEESSLIDDAHIVDLENNPDFLGQDFLIELSTFPLSPEGLRILDDLSLDEIVLLRQTLEITGNLSIPVCNNLIAYLTGRGWEKLLTAWNVWGTLRRWIHPSKTRMFRTALWVWYAAPHFHGAADIEGTGREN